MISISTLTVTPKQSFATSLLRFRDCALALLLLEAVALRSFFIALHSSMTTRYFENFAYAYEKYVYFSKAATWARIIDTCNIACKSVIAKGRSKERRYVHSATLLTLDCKTSVTFLYIAEHHCTCPEKSHLFRTMCGHSKILFTSLTVRLML